MFTLIGKTKRYVCIFAFIASVVLFSANAWSVQERYALVIGNSEYSASNRLKNAVNDAYLMSTTLRKKGFKVTVLTNANKRRINEAVKKLSKKVRGNNVGLFYFAGHGMEIDGSNYLIPTGAEIEQQSDVEYESISLGHVMSSLSASNDGLNVVVLDACRNNPYTRNFRSYNRRGLARVNPPTGSIVLYATQPGDVADDGHGRNGLFTEHLVSAIEKPGLRIEDVFKQTAISVNRASNKKQTPYYEGVLLGDFYFLPKQLLAINKPSPVHVPQSLSIDQRPVQQTYPQTQNQKELPKSAWDSDLGTVSAEDKQQPLIVSSLTMPSLFSSQEYTSASGIEFVDVPGGCYEMGTNRLSLHERPIHQVCVENFKLSKFEVTQGMWRSVMRSNPASFKKSDKHPIESVSWNDVHSFIEKLNRREGRTYRLPSEAEWEYAARLGSATNKSGAKPAKASGELEANCRYCSSASGGMSTTTVGSFEADALGLHDMLGNVREWVSDCWNTNYSGAPVDGQPWYRGECSRRVLRGGSWNSAAKRVSEYTRERGVAAGWGNNQNGFRLVLED